MTDWLTDTQDCLWLWGLYTEHKAYLVPLISARPQRQTNAEGCRIFGDLDQLKSKDTIYTKNGRLIPTAKRGKEIKQPWIKLKQIQYIMPDISVWKTNLLRGYSFSFGPRRRFVFQTEISGIIYYICFNLIHGCFISFPLFAVGISLPFFVYYPVPLDDLLAPRSQSETKNGMDWKLIACHRNYPNVSRTRPFPISRCK